jgi:hypothetical protein
LRPEPSRQGGQPSSSSCITRHRLGQMPRGAGAMTPLGSIEFLSASWSSEHDPLPFNPTWRVILHGHGKKNTFCVRHRTDVITRGRDRPCSYQARKQYRQGRSEGWLSCRGLVGRTRWVAVPRSTFGVCRWQLYRSQCWGPGGYWLITASMTISSTRSLERSPTIHPGFSFLSVRRSRTRFWLNFQVHSQGASHFTLP